MKEFRNDDLIIANFTKRNVGFHGDVFFVNEKLPADFHTMTKLECGTVALGEATGHSHTFFGEKGSFDLRECPKTKVKYLQVFAGFEMPTIKHQEHRPTMFPPGTYRIGIQREYDPFSKKIRAVVD